MPTYLTPGVYTERADAGATIVSPLRTDIAGFVGIARRGPVGVAVPVESWRQFVAHFGDLTGAGYLAWAVRGFFENGGRRCWIVRVASAAAKAASTDARAAAPLPAPAPPAILAWSIAAASPGVWGNELEIEWRETHRAQTAADPLRSAPEYSTVRSVAGFERGTHVRAFVAPAAPAYRVVAAVDPDRQRLYWVNPRPSQRLAYNGAVYEQPLTGYDSARPLVIESIEYTLLVRELGRLIAIVQGLSLVPGHRRYGPSVLGPLAVPRARESSAAGTLPADAPPDPVTVLEHRQAAAMTQLWPLAATALERRALTGGLDGLAPLGVRDYLGEAPAVLDPAETQARKRRGLRALEMTPEVAIVAIPDVHIQPAAPPITKFQPPCAVNPCLPPPPQPPAAPHVPALGDLPPRFTLDQILAVQQALVEHCETSRDRVALIDPPFETVHDSRLGLGPLRAWRRRFDSSFAAFYGPWLLTPDPLMLTPSGLRAIPPSGHVAGFIARIDVASGVHRAPANGALNWVQAVTLPIDDAGHGVLNPEHVNAIRVFAGRGIRIFGARTLSSDPDWRFLNVRRLLLMIEKAIRIGTQWATFEPNNRSTRSKLHLSLTSLLIEMWRRGALAGRTAGEAFFVNCTETENPADSRARGMLVAEVGVAPSKPFEFVVIRIGVSDNALEVAEAGTVEAVP